MRTAEDLKKVIQTQGIEGQIHYLSMPTPTVEAAAEAVGTSTYQIVKSLLFTIGEEAVLVISSGPDRVDRKILAAHFGVGRKRVKLADAPTVLSITGYEVGAVPPFGHKQKIDVILDERVLNQSMIYAGGGSVDALLEISPTELLRVTGADVINLQRPPEKSEP